MTEVQTSALSAKAMVKVNKANNVFIKISFLLDYLLGLAGLGRGSDPG
jgi:hypothetical protein